MLDCIIRCIPCDIIAGWSIIIGTFLTIVVLYIIMKAYTHVQEYGW